MRATTEDYKQYKIKATYFRGDKKYGRTTTVTNTKTGRTQTFMGALTKAEAIRNFKQH